MLLKLLGEGGCMYKTRIAIFQQRDRQIIVIPLDCSFEDRPLSQRCEALANIQKAALKTGLDAPAAAVWRVGNKLRFMAPTEWHPFLKTLTWNTIIANLSGALNCHDVSRQPYVTGLNLANSEQRAGVPKHSP